MNILFILIKAFTEDGQYDKAIEVFHQMQNRSDIRMNERNYLISNAFI